MTCFISQDRDRDRDSKDKERSKDRKREREEKDGEERKRMKVDPDPPRSNGKITSGYCMRFIVLYLCGQGQRAPVRDSSRLRAEQ